MDHIKNY